VEHLIENKAKLILNFNQKSKIQKSENDKRHRNGISLVALFFLKRILRKYFALSIN